MTTPKERAHLLDLLNRTVDWPLVAVVDAIAEVIESRDKTRAEEFRRLAAQKREWRKMAEDCGAMDIALELLHKENTWFEAAQMLEEKLNGDGLK